MPLKENELARRDGSAIECRPDAVRLSWQFTDLAAEDAHALDCHFGCSLRIADSAADRRMFFELFLSDCDAVAIAKIASHFARALQSAASAAALQCKAADVIGSSPQSWIDALIKSAQPIAFAAGLEILPPYQLNLESPSLQRQKIEQLARARAEERTSNQIQQMERAAELLQRFQAMRHAAPELSAGQLLEQISPAERGATLQTLLLASSANRATSMLWAVAGPYLVRIDPQQSPPQTIPAELPTELGPLRSVQPGVIDGKQLLLVGARTGVMVISPDDPKQATLHFHAKIDSQLGFNRVVTDGKRISASHGDAGIVIWEMASPTAPVQQITERAARNIQILDESRVIYSAGSELVVLEGDSRTRLSPHDPSEIIAIIPTPKHMIAVHQSGTLVILDRLTRQIADVRRRGARLSAAGAIPWLGDIRLLLATEDGPVDCLGLDDPLVSEYLSAHRGLKMLSATATLIAAVSPDRQRIVLWNSWDGQRPVGEIHVTAQTKHRVADIEFG
jgi:hypothetical protein